MEGATAVRRSTRTADELDLRAAMSGHPNAEAIVEAYLEARARYEPPPASVPKEFDLYARGVLAMHRQEMDLARSIWDELLALPAEERHWRSTWASYMMLTTRDTSEEAPEDLGRVRVHAAAGMADSLGLGAASLRREARVHEGDHNWAPALEACIQYRAAGGTWGCQDLDDLARRALEDQPHAAARLPLASAAVTAWLNSRKYSTEHVGRWLEVVESVSTPVAGADRIAWAAYRAGAFTQAQRWADRAEPNEPMARWILAKLALRQGDLEGATNHLEAAIHELPGPDELFDEGPTAHCSHHHHSPIRAARIELGLVLVARDLYPEALTAFLQAGDWMDAAWVAERLLTTAELQIYVDNRFPGATTTTREGGLLDGEDLPLSETPAVLRHLLARRLAREGSWAEALPYYPGTTRPIAAQVAVDLRLGADEARTPEERGEALWNAAWHIKMDGWELVATEMEPDFRVLEGMYQGSDTVGIRASDELSTVEEEQLGQRVLSPTSMERERAERHGPPLDRRYHFVWTAQELAWEAVNLMPPTNPHWDDAACIAGTWTAYRDKAAANRFRKLLVNKGGGTTQGQAARDRNWFWNLNLNGRCRTPPLEAPPSGCAPFGQRGGSLAGLLLLPLLWRRR